MSDDTLPEMQKIVATAVRDKDGKPWVPADELDKLEKLIQDMSINGGIDPKADPSKNTTILGTATPYAYRITIGTK